MELIAIAPSVFRKYCNEVNGNEDISYELACKKLTRNILLAKKMPQREEDIEKGNTLYCYGNLYILVKNDTVIHIKNHKRGNYYSGWKLDRYKYVDISRQLGIPESE